MKAIKSKSPSTYAIGDITKDELMGLYLELQHYEVSSDSFAMRLRQCLESAFYCKINSVSLVQNDEALPSYYREIKEKNERLNNELVECKELNTALSEDNDGLERQLGEMRRDYKSVKEARDEVVECQKTKINKLKEDYRIALFDSKQLKEENDILRGELAHTQKLLEEARKLNP